MMVSNNCAKEEDEEEEKPTIKLKYKNIILVLLNEFGYGTSRKPFPEHMPPSKQTVFRSAKYLNSSRRRRRRLDPQKES